MRPFFWKLRKLKVIKFVFRNLKPYECANVNNGGIKLGYVYAISSLIGGKKGC